MEESSGFVESNLQCKTYETGTFCLMVLLHIIHRNKLVLSLSLLNVPILGVNMLSSLLLRSSLR